MAFVNPFIAAKDKVQYLYWKHLDIGTTYHLELIQPLKATVVEIKQKRFEDGAYLRSAVEVVEDHKEDILGLNKGRQLIMDFPVKTFERALAAVARNILNGLEDSDNVRIKFKKESKQSILMYELERLAPTEQQKEFAHRVYSAQKKEEGVIVRKEEEL